MKWEYKTVKISSDSFFAEEISSFETTEMDKFVNQFGQRGWELVSTQGITDQYFGVVKTTAIVLFFKRPLE